MNNPEWAPWQQDFEHGMFVIWPPDHIRSLINPLRETYSPIALSYCETHISLSQPFLHPPGESEWSKLEALGADIKPFTISYGPLRTWSSGRIIYFEVQPAEQILAVRQALHDTGLFNLSLPHSDGFVPHMTVQEGYAEGTSASDVVNIESGQAVYKSLQKTLSNGTFDCIDIAWIVPDLDFHFRVMRKLFFASLA